MGDLLGGLQREPKTRRRCCAPRIDRFCGRHSIKRVIDFNRIKTRGIVPKEVLVRKISGVEARSPFLIAEPGCPKPNAAHVDDYPDNPAAWLELTATCLYQDIIFIYFITPTVTLLTLIATNYC